MEWGETVSFASNLCRYSLDDCKRKNEIEHEIDGPSVRIGSGRAV